MTHLIKSEEIIDIHVHFGGPAGENQTMYFWSDAFKRSKTFDAMKLALRMSSAQVSGFRYLDVLLHQVRQSKFVDKIVLLALDKVYSENGEVQNNKTHLYVNNSYLYHLSSMYREFLFACSVHPYAPDALHRLWHCADSGAVLNKWIPSAQGIDPTHPLSIRFYRALAALKLPLLLHVGPEEAVPTSLGEKDERLYNAAAGKYGTTPGDAISMALDEGVTVIVAHCATPLGPHIDRHNKYWEQIFEALLDRIQRTDLRLPLYADLSALCLPGRFKYIRRIIPLAKELPHKFLYGSDYPVPIIAMSDTKIIDNLLETIGWLARRALPHNDFDLNYSLLSSVFSKRCFTAAHQVLRNPGLPLPEYSKFMKNFESGRKNIFRLPSAFRRIFSR